ncbi:MAG TPA: hypothetical protein VLF93_07525 [Candidatus Saccharimonadales bacterium]|nr:hypothetical protein [Candidatus Saccharimonadales bacterium]
MNYKSRILTAIATGAVLVGTLAPLASADTVNVTGNGALSNSAVNVSNSSSTVVNQTNNANISNNINSNASTGGNSGSFNTGGNTTIKTGDANNTINVTNAANMNQATVSCGCTVGGGTNVSVTGNGAESSNGVSANNANQVFLNQGNNANFNNRVNANSSTGKNDSSFETGGSSVIVSGNATTNVSVNNAANANVANVGGNGGSSDPSSVTITGNGALSSNGVALDQNSAVVLNQANDANIRNDIKANAKTGFNQEQFNTGGNNGIESGNATDNVKVNNLANFNVADVNCDCTLSDLAVKVGGNGAESDNAVDASSSNSVFPNQINDEGIWNGVNGGSKTGDNSLGFGTGSVFGDPVIFSGNGSSSTDVNNVGNVNSLNNGNSVSIPGTNFGFDFDLNGLMSFLGNLTV